MGVGVSGARLRAVTNRYLPADGELVLEYLHELISQLGLAEPQHWHPASRGGFEFRIHPEHAAAALRAVDYQRHAPFYRPTHGGGTPWEWEGVPIRYDVHTDEPVLVRIGAPLQTSSRFLPWLVQRLACPIRVTDAESEAVARDWLLERGYLREGT